MAENGSRRAQWGVPRGEHGLPIADSVLCHVLTCASTGFHSGSSEQVSSIRSCLKEKVGMFGIKLSEIQRTSTVGFLKKHNCLASLYVHLQIALTVLILLSKRSKEHSVSSIISLQVVTVPSFSLMHKGMGSNKKHQ